MLRNAQYVSVFCVLVLAAAGLGAQEFDENPFVSEIMFRGGTGLDLNDGGGLLSAPLGFSASARHDFVLGPGLPLFHLGLAGGYERITVNALSLPLDLGEARLVAGLEFPLFPRLRFGVELGGGAYFGGIAGGGALFAANGTLRYRVAPRFSVMAAGGASLRTGYIPAGSAAGALIRASLGFSTVYHFGVPNLQPFGFDGLVLDTVYPVLGEHYADAPVGSVVVTNTGPFPVQNITITSGLRELGTERTEAAPLQSIAPGESATIPILVGIGGDDRDFRRSGELSGTLRLNYRYRGWNRSQQITLEPAVIAGQDLDWNDPASLALFVHPDAPPIAALGGQVASLADTVGTKQVSRALRVAALATALVGSYELADPAIQGTPWTQLRASASPDSALYARRSIEPGAQPGETERAILLASLMEAAGTPAALLGVGERLLVAVGLPGGEDAESYPRPEALITDDAGDLWFPIDPIETSGDLLAAHQAASLVLGAAGAEVRIAVLRQAWQSVPPSFLADTGQVAPELDAELSVRYEVGLDSLVSWELEPQVAAQQAAIRRQAGQAGQTQLGSLYARYGRYLDAQRTLTQVLRSGEYVPALLNLGYTWFAQGEYRRALPFFQRAEAQAPFDPQVLLALARVEHSLENYGNAELAYQQLASIDPQLAERFAYLELRGEESQALARAAGLDEFIPWQDPQ